MIHPNPNPEATLQLKRTLAAPREKVFRAWTEPDAVKHWFGPPGYQTSVAEIDLRVGGRYRFGMRQLPDGEVFYNSGTYREVQPPARLVYTWRWERADMDFGETLVTVEFLDRGGETELVLTHELFPNTEERDRHTWGWNGTLDRLVQFLG
ncbi:MAG: SRPBCC domain-containing protein [Candidatus Methylomirabilales bacterium]